MIESIGRSHLQDEDHFARLKVKWKVGDIVVADESRVVDSLDEDVVFASAVTVCYVELLFGTDLEGVIHPLNHNVTLVVKLKDKTDWRLSL